MAREDTRDGSGRAPGGGRGRAAPTGIDPQSARDPVQREGRTQVPVSAAMRTRDVSRGAVTPRHEG